MLGTQLGPDFFKEKLLPLCLKGLKDPVANIRKASTGSLSEVVREFGPDFGVQHVMPPVKELASTDSYLQVGCWEGFCGRG